MEEKEKIVDLYPIPVTIKGTRKIIDQMEKSICKIYKGNGTGFFCIFSNKKIKNLKLLITAYHVIDHNYIKDNKIIKITINDDKYEKDIQIKNNRKIYLNESYDISIIQIKEEDNINCKYLEIDDNLFKENSEYYYLTNSLYVLQYPNKDKASVSYGIFKKIFNDNINHTSNTMPGSSGSPIINLKNNKVIGMHKEAARFDFNIGIFLKNPLIDFINNYSKNNSTFYKEIIKKKERNFSYTIRNSNIQKRIINQKDINFIRNNYFNKSYLKIPKYIENNMNKPHNYNINLTSNFKENKINFNNKNSINRGYIDKSITYKKSEKK